VLVESGHYPEMRKVINGVPKWQASVSVSDSAAKKLGDEPVDLWNRR
jgi:hypothetical protein